MSLNEALTAIELNIASRGGSGPLKYGTAGFRANASGLDYVVYRMGILAVLRSKGLLGKVIGLMITASHNPEEDNGVKLVDPLGEMLEASWEKVATDLANADGLRSAIEDVIRKQNIEWSTGSTVFLGRDTRPSSVRLSNAALSAIRAMGGEAVDCGIVTTPMLHYFVATSNQRNITKPPTNDEYFDKLANAFLKLNNFPASGNYQNFLQFDGANGVGAGAMAKLSPKLVKALEIKIFNSGDGRLNYECGSDFVKVNMKSPVGVPTAGNVRSIAVDGDADRLIYFYTDDKATFHVLDGDRIAILLAAYLMELLQASSLKLNIGLVQTAYANGASTDYISRVLKVPLACTETGVKHLHHKAVEYDIGVYFEANGHGTVVYSDHAKRVIRSAVENQSSTSSVKSAAEKLSGLIELTNEAVGDALSDLLLVETVLRAKGWSLRDWEATYSDLPSRLLKVTIKNRDSVTTKDAARICVTPIGLQEEINQLVANYPNGRSFIRASGTEDVVRVYAEAATQKAADELGARVALAVFNMAEGVGKPPVVP